MQEVLSDRIVSCPQDVSLGFRFRVAQYSAMSDRIRILDASELSAEAESAWVWEVLSSVSAHDPVHVWGIRSGESIAKIRSYYDALGFYDARKNRYEFACGEIFATFGTDLSALGYGPAVPPLGSAAAKVVRSAVNLGILRWIRLSETSRVFPRTKRKTPFEVLSDLIESGAVSPFQMGRSLFFDMADRGLAHDSFEWDLRQSVTE